jgi:hypothetical protein
MKAMLDPRIVAASTHGAAFGLQTECTPVVRITPSSQGCLITWAIGPYPHSDYPSQRPHKLLVPSSLPLSPC